MKTIRNFNYSVIITTEDNRFTYESNDVREAIRASFECADESSEVCICNGYTGEVLFHNGEEPYCTDEMGLMMLGFLMEESWGEQEEENEPVCQMCGGDINENGVCRWCGVVYGAEPSHEMTTAEDMVQGLIKALGGLPS
jgi:hypothetical protein